jgi:hypothetical protein
MKGARKWVWLCFLGAILAAVPVWRQTTSTYRAQLPCDEGQAWANATKEVFIPTKILQLAFQIHLDS